MATKKQFMTVQADKQTLSLTRVHQPTKELHRMSMQTIKHKCITWVYPLTSIDSKKDLSELEDNVTMRLELDTILYTSTV